MENIEGTVQLPLGSYETLREAANANAITSEAKYQEIEALAEKNARYLREAEQFEMILSVWTKHLLGGKKISNADYSKKLLQLVKTFNDQGLVIEIHVEELDGKYYVKPINKAETHTYED
jgi:hypothetical protein